ncbi:MAG TPA: right-handed parallel beta-helix repeat-containing protein [Pseudonocardiaceae bacterium]|nr:right-handed parallel beta-helix repeat-containing protein [Pseudonocardiaceae bacterium]
MIARTNVGRTLAVCSAVLLGVGLISAGVAGASPACTYTIHDVDEARAGISAAVPGDALCFKGVDLADVDLTMFRSGTAAAPIKMISDGQTTIHQLHILADHVVLQGFTIVGGGELLLSGTGIVAQKNTVHDTARGGIICANCADSMIASNTVIRAATAGISISGQRVTVQQNTISATVPADDGDADGVRFFGTGHRILSNAIQDIPARSAAHPDCFQTFDTGHAATAGVEIVGNTCQNVEENCLIATGDERGNRDAPASTRSITFIGNTCATQGEQGVTLRHWPNADLRKNSFSGPNLKRGILISRGSTGCSARDNTTAGNVPPVEVDESSRPGFTGPL